MDGVSDGADDRLPPAAAFTRFNLSCDAAAVPKCCGWGVLAVLAILARVLLAD